MLTTIFKEYAPYCGELNSRENGSLTASAQGQVTSYALDSAQNRGRMMVTPGDEVYENQVRTRVGVNKERMNKAAFHRQTRCFPHRKMWSPAWTFFFLKL